MTDTFTFKTYSEQRLEWLKTRNRPLTDEESDELYRALHAIYVRDWKRHRAKLTERELNRETRALQKAENARLYKKVVREAVQG